MLHDVLLIVLGLVVGAVIGFFLSKHFTQKYMKEKANNEQV